MDNPLPQAFNDSPIIRESIEKLSKCSQIHSCVDELCKLLEDALKASDRVKIRRAIEYSCSIQKVLEISKSLFPNSGEFIVEVQKIIDFLSLKLKY